MTGFNPLPGKWRAFADEVMKAAAKPDEPCPDLAHKASEMVRVQQLGQDLGDQCAFPALRYQAQLFSYSDTKRRAALAPGLKVLAGEVFAILKRLHPEPRSDAADAVAYGLRAVRQPYADDSGEP